MPSDETADLITDVVIPCIIIAGLFLVNGIVFAFIMKYRKRIVNQTDEDLAMAAGGAAGDAIEMERLSRVE